jgi:diamine N-acetyltransferase
MTMHHKDIKLRALEPEDLELLYEWENNDEYWIISNTISPFSRYTLKLYIENSHKTLYETGQLRLMIDLVPEKITIGTIDIFDFDSYHKRAGIGILIADEKYRHKGYATMALQSLIDYCFNTLQLHQLFCNIIENNTESLELFKKIGFKEIGVKKDWLKTIDGYLDERMFQLLDKESEK